MKYNLFSWMGDKDKQSSVLRAEHGVKIESTLPWDLSGAGVSSLCEMAAKSLFIHFSSTGRGKGSSIFRSLSLSLSHTHTHTHTPRMHSEMARLNL